MELDAAELLRAVERRLGSEAVELGSWSSARLLAGDGQGLGVFRVTGTASAGGAVRSWSLILKVLPAAGDAEPSAWSHPLREVRAYDSGLLGGLPGGLAAPRCFGHAEHPGRHHLWLEDLGAEEGSWSLREFARAARLLGRFNGAYLSGRAIPDAPWLSRGWLRAWLAAGAAAVEELPRHASHPLVARVYPPATLRALLDLWERREVLLDALDRLPQVLCHQDAFRRNLFLRSRRLLAVDWAFAGPGPLGGELAALVTASGALLAVDRVEPAALRETALEEYVAGLAERGWSGPRERVELGFTASSALRYGPGVVRIVTGSLLDPAAHRRAAELHGAPLDAVVDNWAAIAAEQARLADEAFRLVDTLG